MSTVVVLNGTSSSGKTTLARAFQEAAGRVFLNFSIDHILYSLPQSAIDSLIAGMGIRNLPYAALDDAFHACVRELAALGRDLVIDNAIVTRTQAERLIAAVDGHQVLLVSVWCPQEVLDERDRARGDRLRGLALRQTATIDQWLDYDLRIDTSAVTPSEGAEQIVAALEKGSLTAIDQTISRLRTA